MDNASKQRTGTNPVENIVFMKNISSGEHYLREGKEPQRVLDNIDLLVKRAELWGISGRSRFEIKLLLEIMANIRPYDNGRCVLIERGMPRHKRIILQHVFYIGSSEMLYNNMNVLEFLMFAMSKFKTDKVELQDQIFEFIIDTGLGGISLTPNKLLTREEKAVVTLITAAYSDSMMIVFNLPEYEFDEVLTGAITKIASFIQSKGKTLILGTQNCFLIEKACSHTAYIADGKIIYQGSVESLRLNFDKVVVIIRDKNISPMMEKLAILLPGCKLSIKDDSLLISNCGKEVSDPGYICKKILEADFLPDQMEIHPKTVQNAYEELVFQHDLQK
jgi:ABC-2 type transport system ATP-binding protein